MYAACSSFSVPAVRKVHFSSAQASDPINGNLLGLLLYFVYKCISTPVPVAAPYYLCVLHRSDTGIVGLNPAPCMEVEQC
jgi:hypothetical protein